MSGVLKVIAAGGCGISIADKVVKNVSELGEGFSKVDIKYIDTSDNNIKEVEHDPKDFFLITTKTSSGKVISGAGGERNSSITGDVVMNTKEFLDKYKFTKPITNEFCVVIFSASGGTGSNVGSLLIKDMVERDIPTIAIVVGDSSSGMSVINTYKVLDGLNKMVRKINKSLTMFYINNHTLGKSGKNKEVSVSQDEKEALANKQVFNLLTGLSLFTSGQNESIDYKDMENFISPYHYTTVKMKPGIYNLVLTNSLSSLPNGLTPMMSRCLTDGSPVNLDGVLLQSYKAGKTVSENALSIYKDKFPLFLVNGVNLLDEEIEHLAKTKGNMENIASAIIVTDIDSGGVEDENGLIF